MNVGICKVKMRLPDNASLKDKRQILKSLLGRVRNRFNVAIAEVDDNDLWQIATLGFVCVSNGTSHANEMLSKVVDFIVSTRPDAEVLDYEIEIVSAL